MFGRSPDCLLVRTIAQSFGRSLARSLTHSRHCFFARSLARSLGRPLDLFSILSRGPGIQITNRMSHHAFLYFLYQYRYRRFASYSPPASLASASFVFAGSFLHFNMLVASDVSSYVVFCELGLRIL